MCNKLTILFFCFLVLVRTTSCTLFHQRQPLIKSFVHTILTVGLLLEEPMQDSEVTDVLAYFHFKVTAVGLPHATNIPLDSIDSAEHKVVLIYFC